MQPRKTRNANLVALRDYMNNKIVVGIGVTDPDDFCPGDPVETHVYAFQGIDRQAAIRGAVGKWSDIIKKNGWECCGLAMNTGAGMPAGWHVRDGELAAFADGFVADGTDADAARYCPEDARACAAMDAAKAWIEKEGGRVG